MSGRKMIINWSGQKSNLDEEQPAETEKKTEQRVFYPRRGSRHHLPGVIRYLVIATSGALVSAFVFYFLKKVGS